ncbi:MAG: hypothetical protein SFU21_10405 [Flavihumibacter sp.]|nr:hypothetical protein [Flavihumibacter sp.]
MEVTSPWTLVRKITFRFLFIYLVLMMDIFNWLSQVPGLNTVLGFIQKGFEWVVHKSNALFFHVKDELVMPNGSGDTSFNWAQVYLYLCVAAAGTIIWTIADRKRMNYTKLNYWFCTALRFYISCMCFLYGIIKLFLQQMPFPNNSQLATSLGDFLPMRLSWMFMGYSSTYQFFSGMMEVIAGLFLIFRRTTTLGVTIASGVFINVMMLNLSYDIPVKLFSIHLTLMCFYLLAQDAPRLYNFFIRNGAVEACNVYQPYFTKKWLRISRIVLKIIFILIAVIVPIAEAISYKEDNSAKKLIITPGVYEVTYFVKGRDTLPPLITDSVRWQDFIIDGRNSGSIKTTDTLFRKRYNRAYFNYRIDTSAQTIGFMKFPGDTSFLFNARFQQPDTLTLQLFTVYKSDSLFVQLKRTKRQFQLAERQFHWLSEANR